MAPASHDPPDQIANRYATRELLGQGAMGQVWRVADQARGGRELALKTLLKRTDHGKSELLLKQEFRWMTQLLHPNCCEVYDYGLTSEGTPYFTMEVVPGKELEKLVPMAPAEARLVLVQLLRALGYLHHQGYVHRDVKSANVRLRPDGVVKLMDFGLMAAIGDAGATSGTLAYMPPEAILRAPLDGRADLYSLGVLLYELLTGQLPFVRASVRECLDAHLYERPVPPSKLAPALPPDLEQVILRLMAKDPAHRYDSAGAVLAALGEAVPMATSVLFPPLVGREHEAAVLQAALEGLARGEGRALLLQGPAGMGKSRLVSAMQVSAQVAHTLCARGAFPAARRVPYPAIAGLLRDLLPALREHIPATLETHLPVLAQILPELEAPPATPLGHAVLERRRLQGVVIEVLVSLAAVQPIVAIVEDLQWAPPESLDLVSRLLELAGQIPLVLVVTARAGFTPPADATLLELAPLAPPAVEAMVRGLLGVQDADPALLAAVRETTSPRELVRHVTSLVRAGALTDRDGIWHFDPTRRGAAVQAADLSPNAGYVCRVLAVMGGEAELEWLACASEMGDDDLLGALDELKRLGLLQGSRRYRFVDEAAQAVVEDVLDDFERRSLHEAIATALAQQDPNPSLERLTEIARHRLAGTNPPSGIPAALEAGLRHAQGFAVDEALAILREALATVEAHPSAAWHATRLALWLRIGQLLHFTGQSADARPALAAAERLAVELGATDALPEIQLALARVALTLAQGADARAACDHALEGFQAAGAHDQVVECLLARSQAHLELGAYTDAVLDATAAVDAAVTPAAQGKAQAAFADLMLDGTPNLHGVAIAHLESAQEALASAGDRIALSRVYGSLGLAKLRAGAYEDAAGAYTHQLMLGLEVGYQDGYVSSLAGLAEVSLHRGNPAEALKMVGDAYRDARQAQNAVPILACQMVTARCCIRAGRHAEAVAELRRLGDVAAGLSQRLRLLAALAEGWLDLGDAAEAWRATEALRDLGARTGATWARVPLAAWRSRLAPRLGLPHDPDELALLASMADHGRDGDRLAALEACTRMALLEERWEDAAGLAEAGRTLAEEVGATALAAGFLGWWAEAELALGRGKAAERFEAMTTLAAQVGDPDLQARAAFGLAASRPYAQGASELASRARAWLDEVAATLSPDDRSWFWEVPERARIREGNFIGFGLPRVRQAPRGFIGPRDGLL